MLKRNTADFLRQKYTESLKHNPRFSLRAFALKMGISPGGLGHLLSKRKRLSLSRAYEIATALRLAEKEKEEFLLLVQIEATKSQEARANLYEKLKSIHPERNEYTNLSLEQFQLISQWYGFALFEILSSFASDWSPQKIARFLGITKVEVEIATQRLLRLEMIEETPQGYKRTKNRVWASSQTPSEALQNYYHGLLEQMALSIKGQTPSEKVIITSVFTFDPSQLPEANKLTLDYADQMFALAMKGKKRTEVYQLITNFFRLNQKHAEKKSDLRSKTI